MPEQAPTIYLRDYTPFSHTIAEVALEFDLHPTATRVRSKIHFAPNPENPSAEMFLHGLELKLLWAKIDGQPVTPTLSDQALTCPVPDAPFVWEAEVEISPETNTSLEGLYMSNGMYCTQCEAEGFRKITYYPDRPDVMAPFTVTIRGDAPVLLSNGNPARQSGGTAIWHDPWPKPAYLFALVAGDLVAHEDKFTTRSGREVALNLYVRGGDEHKCAYAMDALKRAMTWDEEVYGREYDLDIFNIVAVNDFNAGAMENKGLNIFNAAYVLASPETATDADFEQIEAVVAHEYFHNWTGNRITCRDWFQLCLKEGLTVFRDQQFTGDMRSHAVKRIDDAIVMRGYQFTEDGGPLAHPVRPEEFVEINNFYTATVYEKGAEVIGMLKTVVGEDAYAKACTLYFDRHDGQAVTIEDWLAVFADATGQDLDQFKLWYSQAGTPRITATSSMADDTFTLTLTQSLAATPGQDTKRPMHIPVAIGLLAADGREILPTQIVHLTKPRKTLSFPTSTLDWGDAPHGMPIASVLRGFSAPVILEQEMSAIERAVLLAHDTDPFNRWNAGRTLASDVLCNMAAGEDTPDPLLLDGLGAVLNDNALDPAFRARVLQLPTERDVAQALHDSGTTPDPDAIHIARERLSTAIAAHLAPSLDHHYTAHQVDGPFSPDAIAAGHRSLANACLSYLNRLDGGARAAAQFDRARDMTQSIAALACLLRAGVGADALQTFETRWSGDTLVMDKWFALQISCTTPEDAVETAFALTQHAAFTNKTPNRWRAVFGTLAGHQPGFHRADGAGYRLLTDQLIALDQINPQVAASAVKAFQTMDRWDSGRQSLMRAELERLGKQRGLSADTGEMVGRILG